MLFDVRQLVAGPNGKDVVESATRISHFDGKGQNSHLVLSTHEVIWVDTPAGTIRISTIPSNGAAVEVYGGNAKTITFKRI